MFSHNGANGPESPTSMFRPVRQTAAPGSKSAVSNCILFCVGDVKTRDNCKVPTQCLHQHGMPTFHEDLPPVPPPLQLPAHTSLKPHLIRAPRTDAIESVYSNHAREGFVYWYQDHNKRARCSECRRTTYAIYYTPPLKLGAV